MGEENVNKIEEEKQLIGDDKINIKKILSNKYTLIFLVLFVLSLLVNISNFTGIGKNIGIISKIFSGFPSETLVLLSLALALSTICAHFKKFKLMFLPIIIWLLLTTVIVRTTNIPQLKDVTTGNYTLGPDLDPFLYLRHAIEISEGRLKNPDMMRQAPLGVENYVLHSLMPWAIFYFYKFLSLFQSVSVTYAAIILPVVLFIISTIGFLLFVKTLASFKFSNNKSWIISIIASLFYISSPSMLHRTVAGVPEIESLGMVWFWFAFLFFSLAWKEESSKIKIIFYCLLAGILTGLMSWSWGGYRYIYMVIALTTLILFLFEKNRGKNFIIFVSWITPALVIEYLKIGSIKGVIMDLSSTGFAFFVFLIMFLDFILSNSKIKNKLKLEKIKLPSSIKITIIALVLIIVFILLINPKFLGDSIISIFNGLLYPYGKGRVGLTVAENKAPYLTEVIGTFSYLFWFFLIGSTILFYYATKHFSKSKKIILNLFFLLFIAGISFTRFSPQSIFNGENFISKISFFGTILIFIFILLFVYIKNYLKKDEKTISDFKNLDFSHVLLLTFSFWAIISMRGAIRLFFIITPILAMISAFLPAQILEYSKKRKDDLSKFFAIFAIGILILCMASVFLNDSATTAYSVKGEVPSIYTQQWQKAMDWVRKNTSKESIFVHWWDYGYWVQTLGERATVTDGGHANGWWDYTTARYLLTTPKPETALSLMKTYNVSYLLIDSTDLGKYSAYSSIGSDKTGDDRLSWIPVMVSDPKQIQETVNSTIRVYQGGSALDQDIIYKDGEKEIFLPEGKAAIIGVVIESYNYENRSSIKQPIGVFYYNNQQYKIPLKRIYFQGQLMDFKEGINSTIVIIPSIEQTNTQMKIENSGALIYLSEKTEDSLFAQLYLMDDPLKNYPTIKLSHSEDDFLIENLKSQGANIGDFVYYQGFRGPIKIWEVSYPEYVITREEFLRNYGELGELDNLKFKK